MLTVTKSMPKFRLWHFLCIHLLMAWIHSTYSPSWIEYRLTYFTENSGQGSRFQTWLKPQRVYACMPHPKQEQGKQLWQSWFAHGPSVCSAGRGGQEQLLTICVSFHHKQPCNARPTRVHQCNLSTPFLRGTDCFAWPYMCYVFLHAGLASHVTFDTQAGLRTMDSILSNLFGTFTCWVQMST